MKGGGFYRAAWFCARTLMLGRALLQTWLELRSDFEQRDRCSNPERKRHRVKGDADRNVIDQPVVFRVHIRVSFKSGFASGLPCGRCRFNFYRYIRTSHEKVPFTACDDQRRQQKLRISAWIVVTNGRGTTLWDYSVTTYSSRNAISPNSQYRLFRVGGTRTGPPFSMLLSCRAFTAALPSKWLLATTKVFCALPAMVSTRLLPPLIPAAYKGSCNGRCPSLAVKPLFVVAAVQSNITDRRCHQFAGTTGFTQ